MLEVTRELLSEELSSLMTKESLDTLLSVISPLEETLMRPLDWFKLSNILINTERSALLNGNPEKKLWLLILVILN